MSKRNYLNVVSAGVVAFGTLALGLVTVLPVANAANAEHAPNVVEQASVDKFVEAVNNAKTKEEYDKALNNLRGYEQYLSLTPTKVNDFKPAETNPAASQEEENDYGHNEKAPESDPLAYPQLPDAEDHDLGKYMGLDKQDDAKKEEGSEKGAEKTDPKAGKKADKSTEQKTEQTKATEPAKDQQHVKKGHHKFGAPNTGYEF